MICCYAALLNYMHISEPRVVHTPGWKMRNSPTRDWDLSNFPVVRSHGLTKAKYNWPSKHWFLPSTTLWRHILYNDVIRRPCQYGEKRIEINVVYCVALRSIAAHRDRFVQRLSVRPSVCPVVTPFLVVTHSYVSQATHAFLRMLPLCLLLRCWFCAFCK